MYQSILFLSAIKYINSNWRKNINDKWGRQAKTIEHKDMSQAREKPQDGENPWSNLLIISIKCSAEKEYNNSESKLSCQIGDPISLPLDKEGLHKLMTYCCRSLFWLGSTVSLNSFKMPPINCFNLFVPMSKHWSFFAALQALFLNATASTTAF